MTNSSTSTILELSDGTLFALTNTYELDGRPVSTHPAAARGFAPVNNYLYLRAGEGLLIDTGLAIHEAAVLQQLATMIDSSTPLALLILRASEYSSVSNARPIADHFNVTRIMMGGGIRPEDIHKWLDFEPSSTHWRQPSGLSRLAEAEPWSPVGAKTVAGPGGMALELIRPGLQLISTYWLYDNVTRTLFTSDAFSHVWRNSSSGPWTVVDPNDAPSVEELCDYLAGARYWWLAGARTQQLREGLQALRKSHAIHRIAPNNGCVLIGEDVVARHFDLFDEALERLSHRRPVAEDLVFHLEETM